MTKKKKIISLIVSLAISLGVGGLSALSTMNSDEVYNSLNQPALAPPSWLFPVVWSILFALMGISAYLVYVSDSPIKKQALTIYAVQLAVNFVWPLLFFRLEAFLFSFLWILLLIVLVVEMAAAFYKANKTAGLLQIPYILWLIFAAYLNFMIFRLN